MSLSEDVKMLKQAVKEKIKDQKSSQNIPNFTCPLIDEVKEAIDDSIERLEEHISIFKNNKITGVQEIRKILKRLTRSLNTMEDIRLANDELREIGKAWYNITKEIALEL